MQLRDPLDVPNAVKGLYGMQVAHEMLQESGSVGILIGGLSEAVWNARRKGEDLDKHKDVDVAVLTEDFQPDRFEGGIDWWLPEESEINFIDDYSDSELTETEKRWVNGNNVVLAFKIGGGVYLPDDTEDFSKRVSLSPGLYIPDSEWVVNMRRYEVDSHIDENVDAYDAMESFERRTRRKLGTRLPKFIRDAFTGYILSPAYEKSANKVNCIGVYPFDLNTLAAIHSTRGSDFAGIEVDEVLEDD